MDAAKNPQFMEQADTCNTNALVNGICPYFTMFPLEYPLGCLADATIGDWVYDPFCGRGTTIFAARLKGLNAVGTDLNPVAIAIAQAKFFSIDPEKLSRLLDDLLLQNIEFYIPTGEFWEAAFNAATLEQLCKVRQGLIGLNTPAAQALRALILGILHGPTNKGEKSYLSNQMPRTFASKPDYSVRYWHEKSLEPPQVDLRELVNRKAIRFFTNQPKGIKGFAKLADARKPGRIARSKFKYIITSPPYYGMDTYKQDQWLRLWFLGGHPHPVYGDKSQIAHTGELKFIQQLAEVWDSCGKRATTDAKMFIRFGALPSKATSPEDLMRASFLLTKYWEVESVIDAGCPEDHNRQANHMGAKASKHKHISEVDVVCRRKNV